MHYDTSNSIFILTFSISDTDPHLRPGESLPSGELAMQLILRVIRFGVYEQLALLHTSSALSAKNRRHNQELNSTIKTFSWSKMTTHNTRSESLFF